MDPHLRDARRQSAAQELGRRNPVMVLYGRSVAVLGGLVGVVLGGWWVVRKLAAADLAPGWHTVLMTVLVVAFVVLALVLIVRVAGRGRGTRPPRMPRGF